MKRYTLIDKTFLLKRTPLFEKLDLDLLLPIADKMLLSKFEPGSLVFQHGEEGHRMYFIIQGTLDILDEKGKPLAKLKGDDFFGDEVIFNDKKREYSACCIDETWLFSLSRNNLLTIISECPSVAVGLLQAYTETTPFRIRGSSKKDKS